MRTFILIGAALLGLSAMHAPAAAQSTCSGHRAACLKACADSRGGCTNICADAYSGCMRTGTWSGRQVTKSGLKKQ